MGREQRPQGKALILGVLGRVPDEFTWKGDVSIIIQSRSIWKVFGVLMDLGNKIRITITSGHSTLVNFTFDEAFLCKMQDENRSVMEEQTNNHFAFFMEVLTPTFRQMGSMVYAGKPADLSINTQMDFRGSGSEFNDFCSFLLAS